MGLALFLWPGCGWWGRQALENLHREDAQVHGRRGLCAGVWLLAAATAIVSIYFGEVILDRGVYYLGDVARIYLPQRVALTRAMARGTLPWWTAGIGAGYPLLAEGEVAAFYPLNWLMCAVLPVDRALSASIIVHYLLAGAGFFAWARSSRLSRGAAYFGAIVLALGGFNIAHLSHVSILSVAAWMPWMFFFTRVLLGRRPDNRMMASLGWALGLALVVGIQFLAGHAQISMMGLAALSVYALWTGWASRAPRARLYAWLGAVLLGVLLGAPQLLPMAELSRLSQRAGGLDARFFTSYSFHPLLLATFVSPFALGNPYPTGSVELMGYVGLMPLALASVALWRSRRREKWFFAGLALCGVLLAFGRWNPMYRVLRHIPILNLFRVPARYLCLTSLGLALLSAIGLDALERQARSRPGPMGWALLGVIGVSLATALAGVRSAPDVEGLVAVWRWLPVTFLVATGAVVLGAGRVGTNLCKMAACLVLLVDLYAFGAVLDGTYNATVPHQEAVRKPQSLSWFAQDDGLYRLYTKEEIIPALSVMRESYYPNLALTYGLPSANIYLPLVPRSYAAFIDDLDAHRLNLLNVKYYLIPQLLPVDEASELYDVHNPFASLPANVWLQVPQLDLAGLDVESYLSHSTHLPDGELVAELVLRDASGREERIPLRAGLDTAEWAYEREDVAAKIAHAMPQVATTWPAISGWPPGEHPGHSYVARVALDAPLRLKEVMWRPARPEAFVRLERVRLRETSGRTRLLSHLVGLGDHSIAYRSQDVVVYRNEDVLPRAYALPQNAVTVSGGRVSLPKPLRAEELLPVQVVTYEDMLVVLRARTEEPAYLILADLAYPGWRATVDGVEPPILVADGVFRALALSPGEHEIVFSYKPTWGISRP